jgi:glutaredoxin-like protein
MNATTATPLPNREGHRIPDADTMRHDIAPNAKLPSQVAVLTRVGCPFCAKAKKMLSDAGYEFAEVALPHTTRSRAPGAIARAQTVPPVFVDGHVVGGSEALKRSLAGHHRQVA